MNLFGPGDQSTVGVVTPIATHLQAERHLAEWQKSSGRDLNPGQHSAAIAVVTSADRYNVIQGSAGVGKTTLVNGIKSVAESQGVVMRGLSQGGSQSRTLQEETGIQSSTIASFVSHTKSMQGNELRDRHGGELWVVDEASQASQKDVTRLVRLAEVAGARIVFVGDREQLLSIESGTAMALAMDGSRIAVSKVDEIVRQHDLSDRQMVSLAAQGKVAEAISERIQESKDLVKSAATQYLTLSSSQSDRRETVVLTGLNADRRQINEEIRSALKDKGDLERGGQHGSALIKTDLTSAELHDARSWIKLENAIERDNRSADIVVQVQRKYAHLPTEAGEVLKVESIRPGDNSLVVSRAGGESFTINLDRTRKIEAFLRENREWSVGDTVRFTLNDRVNGVANGDIGRIVDHNKDAIKIETAGKTVEMGIHNARVDYGYAATVHASQGWSKADVVWAARTDRGVSVLDTRTGYVAVSRAKGSTTIITDNAKKLTASLEVRRENESAMAAIGEVKLNQTLSKLDALQAQRSLHVKDQQQARGLER